MCCLLSDVFVFCCLLLILLLLLSLFCCCRRSSLSFCSFYLYFVSFSDFCLLLVKPLDVEVDLYVESFANIAEANMVGNQSFSLDVAAGLCCTYVKVLNVITVLNEIKS